MKDVAYTINILCFLLKKIVLVMLFFYYYVLQ